MQAERELEPECRMTNAKPIPLKMFDPKAPPVSSSALDTVWLQVGGTICNLRCHHCFISCSPENGKFAFMSADTCRKYLDEAVALGAKEFYFTGGEPFANPEMCDILEMALRHGPATVLTNATLFRPKIVERLARMHRESEFALELRVSLDGYSARMNDPIRGAGTFDQAMEGVRRVVRVGLRPIITITRTWCGCDDEVRSGFAKSLEEQGYAEPRLKILPLLKMGAEVSRTGGFCAQAKVTAEMMADYDQSQLLCSSSRLVTDRGVWVCPILPDVPEARMGDTLAETLRDFPLGHAACHTCYHNGAICSNATG